MHSPDACTTKISSADGSAYQVETIERLFRRFRQVDPSNTSTSSIQAVSATNQLVVMRERLQAGLSGRLLELKAEMDKEFGTAFVDMESCLRTERGMVAGQAVGRPNIQSCVDHYTQYAEVGRQGEPALCLLQ